MAAALCAPAILATTFIAAVPQTAKAQEVAVVFGEYGGSKSIQRMNTQTTSGSPVVWAQLLSIPGNLRIRGATSPNNDPLHPTSFLVYTEMDNGTSQIWNVNYTNAQATLSLAPIQWGPTGATRPEDMVLFIRTGPGLPGSSLATGGATASNLTLPPSWHAILGVSGFLYGPSLPPTIGNTSCGASGSITLPQPHVGGAAYNNHLHIISGGSNMRMHRFSMPCSQGLLGAPNGPVSTQAWNIPVQGQVLGFTISEEGYFYAIVNRVQVLGGQASGYTELVRSTAPIDSTPGTIQLDSCGDHLYDWTSDTTAPLVLPPVYMSVLNG